MNANCDGNPEVRIYGTKTIISICGWGYPAKSVHEHFLGLPENADISHDICPKCAQAMREAAAPMIARRRQEALVSA